jgi:hypothetical protein
MKTRGQVINTLYRLKMDYGIPATLKNIGLSATNHKTGAISKTFETVDLQRVILLPQQSAAQILYTLSASQNFNYGGRFNIHHRTIIIDGKDLPKIFEISMTTLLILGSITYATKSFEKILDNLGYLLTIGATNE